MARAWRVHSVGTVHAWHVQLLDAAILHHDYTCACGGLVRVQPLDAARAQRRAHCRREGARERAVAWRRRGRDVRVHDLPSVEGRLAHALQEGRTA